MVIVILRLFIYHVLLINFLFLFCVNIILLLLQYFYNVLTCMFIIFFLNKFFFQVCNNLALNVTTNNVTTPFKVQFGNKDYVESFNIKNCSKIWCDLVERTNYHIEINLTMRKFFNVNYVN